ncbi:hypothetical protein ABW19_dt0207491 [Dactylella cylindrospora]|nr:hypothetical protein ABW19_dt0207491 [Dactylella cylindrospora]
MTLTAYLGAASSFSRQPSWYGYGTSGPSQPAAGLSALGLQDVAYSELQVTMLCIYLDHSTPNLSITNRNTRIASRGSGEHEGPMGGSRDIAQDDSLSSRRCCTVPSRLCSSSDIPIGPSVSSPQTCSPLVHLDHRRHIPVPQVIPAHPGCS